ncbi:DEAD/DEAH box helicase [Microbacterium sp.]|uniref:DEAD/DEAH box helicase n=1 Tax=Microbacterium sp. TaxID=51671 RepID=UPI003C215731
MNEDRSLRITFAETATRVRLTAPAAYEEDLRRLVPRFRSVVQPAPGIAELDLDDFLSNLIVLASWTDPASVSWAIDIQQLAESSVRDARRAAALLDDSSGPTEIVDLEAALGSRWQGNLTDFQRRDVQKLLSLGHGANFSVPGAGKTRVALALYAAAKTAGTVDRLLVVGPKSCYDAWREETETCFTLPPMVTVLDQSIPLSTEILVVNYERLDASLGLLSSWLSARPSMLILDEAHRMKLGAQGTYGSACLSLGPRARRRLILSGTPAPNGVRDLENLMGFVWPGHGRQSVTRAVAGGNLQQASVALRPLFTRTTKRELGLPPQIPVIRRIPMPPLHREIYDALVNQVSPRAMTSRRDLEALGKVLMYLLMAATSPALLSVGTTRYEPLAYRVPPLQVPEGEPLFDLMRDLPAYELSPKYAETLSIVAQNALLGRKTLVWSTFVRSLTTLQRLLGQFNPALVHGGTPDREEQIRRFRNDPDCFVLLSNPATLGEGISLHHECNDAIFVDRDFAAGRFLQALDRIHRLGLPEEATTRVTILSSVGTIDEVVEQRLEMKLRFMGQILDDADVEQLGDLDEEPSVAGGLDDADVRAFLSHLHVDPA